MKLAADDEYPTFIENNIWDLVPCFSSANIIRSMWIFTYKLCMLENGETQRVHIDCGETFNPIVKPATIHAILSLSLSKHWLIHHLDVKNTFFMVR